MKIKIFLFIFVLSLFYIGSAKAAGICVCQDMSCLDVSDMIVSDQAGFCADVPCKGGYVPPATFKDCVARNAVYNKTNAIGTTVSGVIGQILPPLQPAQDEIGKLKTAAGETLNPVKFSTGSTGVFQIISKIINFFVGTAGMVSMMLYIWAGFLWMSAAGNAENVGKAQQILMWTTLGVVVTLSSYILLDFVINTVLHP